MSAIAQRRLAGATALMILLYLLQVALFAPNAGADHTTFEIDAQTEANPGGANRTVDVNGNVDWDTGDADPSYNIQTKVDGCGNDAEDRIEPSTKLSFAEWPVEESQPVAPKGDICQVWTATHVDSSGDVILYVGWLRDAATGEVSVYLPLEAAPDGHEGNVLIQFDYVSNAKSIDVRAFEWDASAAYPWVEMANPPEESAVSSDNLFAEVAFNLSEAILDDLDGCKNLVGASLITETGEGNQSEPTLFDIVRLGEALSFSTCGSIVVEKQTVPSGYSGPFTVNLLQNGGELGSAALSGDGDTYTFEDVAPGTYALSEDDPSATGFELDSIVCDGVDVTDGTFEVGERETVRCVVTNTALPGSLTLVKTVDINYGGIATADDFQAKVDGDDVDWDTAIPLDVGTHTASETAVTYDGYNAGSWGGDCAADGSVDIGPGENKTCTITNSDAPLSVDLEKIVDVSDLPAPGGDFTYTLTVTNTSGESVTITELTDTQSGATDFSDCLGLVGTELAPGADDSCTYVVGQSVPGSYPNTAAVTVEDDEERTASDSDSETVRVSAGEIVVSLEKEVVGDDSLPEPGGTFTFKLTITNNSAVAVDIDSLTDDNSADSDDWASTCGLLVGTSLAAGGSTECTYTLDHGDVGTYPNTANVTVSYEDQTDTDTDSESVEVTDVLPTVTIVKTAEPLSLDEPGGDFEFTLEITNTSIETVTITDLDDTHWGEEVDSSACEALVGTALEPGESTSCSYIVTFNDGGVYDNTAHVEVTDDEQNTATDDDTERVEVLGVGPVVQLDKVANPTTLQVPGGLFTFTLTVTNLSVETVWIDELLDDQSDQAVDFSDCDDLIGELLEPGESIDCTYQVSHTEVGTYVNNASVTVLDDEEESDSDTATATVTVTSTPPPPPGTATVTLSSICVTDDGGNGFGRVTVDINPANGATVTVNGQVVADGGIIDLADEATYVVTVVANGGFVLGGDVPTEVTIGDCPDVLGTTVTTVPEVSADTLPFTGFESGDTVKLGLLALLAGALLLFAVRGPKEEEEIATEMGGWSDL